MTKTHFFSNKSYGFSLVEVMIAVALTGGLALTAMKLFQNQNTAQKTVESNYEITATFNEIRNILTIQDNCSITFKNESPESASIQALKRLSNGTEVQSFKTNETLPGNIKISKIELFQGTNEGPKETNVRIIFQRGSDKDKREVGKILRISYTENAGKIVTCYAMGSNFDSLWVQSTEDQGNILYSGRIGIGQVTNPASQLEVRSNNVETTEALLVSHSPLFTGPTDKEYSSFKSVFQANSNHDYSESVASAKNQVIIDLPQNNSIKHTAATVSEINIKSGAKIKEANAHQSLIINDGGASIETAIGTGTIISGNGIKTGIGLFIGPIKAEKAFGIFQADEEITNFFAGDINVGSNIEKANLHVRGTVYSEAFIFTSDRRLKDKINPISHALERVLKLKGREFSWKSSGEEDLGFIAQEIVQEEKNLVQEDSDGYLAVKYANVVPLTVEAIRELHTENQKLKKRLESLEQRLERLETK